MPKCRIFQIQGRKDGQAKPAELNMTKLVDNSEILTLDTESMSSETLSKKSNLL